MNQALTETRSTHELNADLKRLFGSDAYAEPLSSEGRMGRRIHGVDLTAPLAQEQAQLIVALLDQFQIISFPNQGGSSFQLRSMERLANHFGAPIPHPKNFANYIDYKKKKEPLRLLPVERQTATLCNQAFPDAIRCIDDADSPAVYIVTNLTGSGRDKEEQLASGLHWHTDIEFEPIPLSTSMLYVQSAPVTRDSGSGTWVDDVLPDAGFYHPDSAEELMKRRLALPLNGETAYADTVAALADLPETKQAELDRVLVRRRLRANDPGWLVPLLYTNPRNGMKSLHSPVWASRGKNIAPVEVEGLSPEDSREYLDELEMHVLQSKYRYDHVHAVGDITIWSNFSTLHNAPPVKSVVNKPEDARLMYRISCKGEPSYTLPRNDEEGWIETNILPPYRSPVSYVS